SPGNYHFFHIFTEANEVFDIIAMTYAHHVLFDDRTSVQFFGYIVASCTNEFDPANCSLVIWTGSNKGRQKAVMNIDHPARILLAEAGGQYLHITSQDNTICILFLHQTSNLVKSRSLVLRVDRNMMEGNTMPLDHAAQIFMVGNNTGDFTVQFATVKTMQQICQAVGLPAGHEHHFFALGRVAYTPFHPEFTCNRRKYGAQAVRIEGQRVGTDFMSHEEPGRQGVRVVPGFGNPAVLGCQQVTDLAHYSHA